MIASGMAIGINLPTKAVAEKIVEGDKPIPNNTLEETSEKISQIGETVRENIKINREVLEKGIEEINQNIRIFNTKLSFYIDEPTGRTVIKISDRETDEVIREVPPVEFLKIAAKLSDILGVIIDQKAWIIKDTF